MNDLTLVLDTRGATVNGGRPVANSLSHIAILFAKTVCFTSFFPSGVPLELIIEGWEKIL